MNSRELMSSSLLRRFSGAGALLLLAVGAVKAADYPSTITNDNPSAYYRFEETSGGTANDSSTNDVPATIVYNGENTSPVLGAPGIDSNSFNFIVPGPGGESDFGYVDIPESPLITPANGTNAAAFSAELWVRPNGFPADWSVPIAQGLNNGTAFDGWNIYVSGPGAGNGNTAYFYLVMRPSVFIGYPDFPISYGQWYHLVVTYDGTGTNADFYINGVQHVESFPVGSYLPDFTEDALVASGSSIGWDSFNGNVDEVAFYDYVLSDTQVTNHYTVGLGSFSAAPTPVAILTSPSGETNFSGIPVTFTVTATGTGPITYTWTTNGVVTGTDTNFLTFTPQFPGDTNDQIAVTVSNAYGPAVTSTPVSLTVLNNLNIVAPPGSIQRNVGSYAAFHVTADGAVPINYQWSVSSNGGSSFSPIFGATNESLWLTNVQLSESGNQYSVLVTNPFFSSSQSASLSVVPRTDPPVPLTGYGAIVAADKPVAYWRLDESGGSLAEDAVGSFDGTYTTNAGSITYDAPTGIPHSTDPAVILSGGATIQVPWAPELNPDTAWSVETWIQPSTVGDQYRVVLSSEYNFYPYAYNGWYLYAQAGTPSTLAFVPQPGNGFIVAPNSLIVGDWYHVVIADDTTNFYLYVNGQLGSSYPAALDQLIPNGDGINPDGLGALPSGDDGDDGGNFVIGQRTDAAFGTFLGTVDDTAVYNYALSPEQVKLHYADATLLTIVKSGVNQATLTWSLGVLQSSSSLTGTYTDVPNATSPYTVTLGDNTTFYRVELP